MRRNIYSSEGYAVARNIIIYLIVVFLLLTLPFFANKMSDGILFPFFPILIIYKNRNILALNILMTILFDVLCGFIFPITTLAYIATKTVHESILPFILNKIIYKNWGLYSLFVSIFFVFNLIGLIAINAEFYLPYLIFDYILVVLIYPIFSIIPHTFFKG